MAPTPCGHLHDLHRPPGPLAPPTRERLLPLPRKGSGIHKSVQLPPPSLQGVGDQGLRAGTPAARRSHTRTHAHAQRGQCMERAHEIRTSAVAILGNFDTSIECVAAPPTVPAMDLHPLSINLALGLHVERGA